MSTQQYLAHQLTEGRAWSRQDRALLRDVELARELAPVQPGQRDRWTRRFFADRG